MNIISHLKKRSAYSFSDIKYSKAGPIATESKLHTRKALSFALEVILCLGKVST